jgi:hypothetical protein
VVRGQKEGEGQEALMVDGFAVVYS